MVKPLYLLLGSNLGDRKAFLDRAHVEIASRIGPVVRSSSVYETEPWGMGDVPWFLNMALVVETALQPEEILAATKDVEEALGRTMEPDRASGFVSRVIDIDLLFLGSDVVSWPHLYIPHKSLEKRAFALKALLEISPDLKHPISGKTVREMWHECPDNLTVRLWKGAGDSSDG